jgi:hypothetical protein
LNRISYMTVLLHNAIWFNSCGTVKTLWKYSTGSSSVRRFSSHSALASAVSS